MRRLASAIGLRYCSQHGIHTTSLSRGHMQYRKTRVAAEDRINPLTKPTVIDKAVLHVVSVPIGNLKDFSLRALDILRDVDYIVTSDRPATKTLLDLVDIPNQGRLIHYSRNNRSATQEQLAELLKGGRSMALVTTSGTPCVGDIGAELVREMQRQGIRVAAVPGPSAVMAALATAGVTGSPYEASKRTGEADDNSPEQHSGTSAMSLQDGSFFFGNMLPESHGARLRVLRNVVGPATFPCVFYEVPRRLQQVIRDIAVVLPHRRVSVTHELTKLNESLHADTADRLSAFYARPEASNMLKKGQLVLIIEAAGALETRAWLQNEARKRHRLRKSVANLVSASSNDTSSSASRDTPSKKNRRLTRLKRRRQKMIEQITQAQERLRLNMSINRSDALKP